jgi:hypothetical protein
LTPNNLAQLLSQQREQIADAMPSGLADALQDSGIGLILSAEGRTKDKSRGADAQPSR